MKCSRCSKELAEDQRYVYQGKVMCEDCVMEVGLSLKECDPWASYVDTAARKRHGQTGVDGLTDAEAKVYEFVKSKGRVTRAEVAQRLGVAEGELDISLGILMHNELVKEFGEHGTRLLAAIQ